MTNFNLATHGYSHSSNTGVAIVTTLSPYGVISVTKARPRFASVKPSNNRQLSSGTNKGLSRTERRMIERKQRNREKHQEKHVTPNRDETHVVINGTEATTTSLKPNPRATARTRIIAFLESLTPKVPGRQNLFRRPEWIALAYRLPLFLAICYVMSDENVSPYIVQASLGPSMLPTIQFVGDIWLVETGAWKRAWRRLWKNHDSNKSNNDPHSSSSFSSSDYQVGDLVLWKEPTTGQVSCKRIVGLPGDVIQRYGQYATMYRSRLDWGIIWPNDAKRRNLDPNCPWDKTKSTSSVGNDNGHTGEHDNSNILKTLIVPSDCVWLEGDNCLFSVDSRQYGPIPITWICGRLVFRLWPWTREELMGDERYSYLSSCWISRRRPVPFPSPELYLGKRFNFYKL